MLLNSTHFNNNSVSCGGNREIVEAKPMFLRLGRLRLSAIVSSRTAPSKLYRPTPTACQNKNEMKEQWRSKEEKRKEKKERRT